MSDTLEARRAFIRERWPDSEPERCSGRSTAVALATIAEAMKWPGNSVRVKDHYDSAQADRHLLDMIMDYIALLGFSGFTVVKKGPELRLRFDLGANEAGPTF